MKNNKELKVAGVWMDHSEAFVIEPEHGKVKHLLSPGISHVRHAGEGSDGVKLGNHRSTNNEFSKHEREQQINHTFYKELAVALHHYDNIYVFGPTTARSEFANYVKKERLLSGKNIETHPADKMTDNQMVALVKKHFE